jgi:hypothetical protein
MRRCYRHPRRWSLRRTIPRRELEIPALTVAADRLAFRPAPEPSASRPPRTAQALADVRGEGPRADPRTASAATRAARAAGVGGCRFGASRTARACGHRTGSEGAAGRDRSRVEGTRQLAGRRRSRRSGRGDHVAGWLADRSIGQRSGSWRFLSSVGDRRRWWASRAGEQAVQIDVSRPCHPGVSTRARGCRQRGRWQTQRSKPGQRPAATPRTIAARRWAAGLETQRRRGSTHTR